MIGLKAVGLLKNISRCPSSRKLFAQQIRRSSHDAEWNYRTFTPPEKWAERSADACAVLAYWWFGWNMYHGWRHLIGMYDGENFLPDPREYTDEELGIPPDNA